jgi:hypothetical protein
MTGINLKGDLNHCFNPCQLATFAIVHNQLNFLVERSFILHRMNLSGQETEKAGENPLFLILFHLPQLYPLP